MNMDVYERSLPSFGLLDDPGEGLSSDLGSEFIDCFSTSFDVTADRKRSKSICFNHHYSAHLNGLL